MDNIIEICCGSYYDAKQAYLGGAKRIELNSSLFMGGLTPSLGSLQETKKNTDLEVICMVRPRGGGFHYNQEDIDTIFLDAKLLLEHGADGLAFGFLHEDNTIDKELTNKMCTLIHSFQKTAVFHRAIDLCEDMDQAFKEILACGCDRVLTSGGQAKAVDATDNLKHLQEVFHQQIDLVAASGINPSNASTFFEVCKLHQIHSSCKNFIEDPTTSNELVSYQFLDNNSYDVVDCEKVKELIRCIKKL